MYHIFFIHSEIVINVVPKIRTKMVWGMNIKWKLVSIYSHCIQCLQVNPTNPSAIPLKMYSYSIYLNKERGNYLLNGPIEQRPKATLLILGWSHIQFAQVCQINLQWYPSYLCYTSIDYVSILQTKEWLLSNCIWRDKITIRS